MSPTLNRRTLFQALAVAGLLPATGAAAPRGVAPALADGALPAQTLPAASPISPPLGTYWLSHVDLGQSVFSAKRDLVRSHLAGYDVNRLLQVFRLNAGVDPGTAVAPGGWEGLDGEANGNLRGHYTGHFLSALSQAYAEGADPALLTKIQTILGSMLDCRTRLAAEPTVLSTQGRFGASANLLRGSYQYIAAPGGLLNGLTRVTLSCWVRPTHGAAFSRVFDFGNGTSQYLYLTTRGANGLPRFAITNGGAGGEQVIASSVVAPLNQWTHLAVTIGDGVGVLYVNGREAAGTPR